MPDVPEQLHRYASVLAAGLPAATIDDVRDRIAVVDRDPEQPVSEEFDQRPTTPHPPVGVAGARSPYWTAAVAALALIVVVASVLVVDDLVRDGGESVDFVGPADDATFPLSTDQTVAVDDLVGLNVIVRQPSPDPMDIGARTVVALGIVDESGGLAAAVSVSGPALVDGTSVVTAFPSLEGLLGTYRLMVWTYPCLANGQCVTDLETLTASPIEDLTAARCEVALDVGPEPQEVFVALADDGTCQVEPPVDEMQAATERLARQLAGGWVPYGGPPEIAGTSTPPGSWTRAGPTEAVDCDYRPDARGIPRLLRCPVYDEPDGVVLGYRYDGLGYVPLELADDFDHGRALLEQRGCDPFADPACA